MSSTPKQSFEACCRLAMELIHRNEYEAAIVMCRQALTHSPPRRAWSKLMLAIRELSRVEVQS